MPATGKFLLDTNIVIALLEGDSTVISHLDSAAEVSFRLLHSASFSSEPRDLDARLIILRRWSDLLPAEPCFLVISMLLANTDV